jgi:hypothetical protein
MAGSLAELITDETPNRLLREVKVALAAAFKDAEIFKDTFTPYLQMVIANREMTRERLALEVAAGTRSLDDFRKEIRTYNSQSELMSCLTSCRDIGVLRVNSKRLKESLMPSPQACVAAISSLLPQLAVSQYRAFITKIHSANRRLNSMPHTVEEFVDFVKFLGECLERKEAYEEEYLNVATHFEVMDEFNIQIPSIDYAAYQTLNPDFQAFKTALDIAEASKDEHVMKFANDLEQQVDDVNAEVAAIRLEAANPVLLNEVSDPDDSMEITAELMAKVTLVKAKADVIHTYQKLFNVAKTRFDELTACVEEIELKHGLWESLSAWADLILHWARAPFEEIDIVVLEEKVSYLVQCSLQDVECSLQDVECSLQDVECSLQDVECSLKGVDCSLKVVECSLKGVECFLKGVQCSLKRVEWSLKGVECSLKVVECSLKGVGCSLKVVECSLKGIECSLKVVECSLKGVECSLKGVECSLQDVECSPKGVECALKVVESSLKGVECSLKVVECSLEGVECSLKGVECSLKGVECSLKGVECSLKVAECSLKGVECSLQVSYYNKMVMKIERGLPPNRVLPVLRDKVFEFKEILPVILNLRNKDLKARHWDKVPNQTNPHTTREALKTLETLKTLKT